MNVDKKDWKYKLLALQNCMKENEITIYCSSAEDLYIVVDDIEQYVGNCAFDYKDVIKSD